MALFFVASRYARGDFHRRYPLKLNPVSEGSCKIMDIGETIYVSSRTEWRRWLKKNHASRNEIWLVQTPQVFRKEIILGAYKRAAAAGWSGTDDASFVERIGVPVGIVQGERVVTLLDAALIANLGSTRTEGKGLVIPNGTGALLADA